MISTKSKKLVGAQYQIIIERERKTERERERERDVGFKNN
jgi:hypothetical protein